MNGSIRVFSYMKIHSTSRLYIAVYLCLMLVFNFFILNSAVAQEQEEKELKLPLFNLKNLDGIAIQNSEIMEKVVVIDFWATWCAPCIKSFPALIETENSYKENDEVIFLYVNTLESANRDTAYIRNFLLSKGFDFQVYMDTPQAGISLADQLDITTLPHKLIVDKSGVIRHRMTGYSGSDEELINDLTTKINELLAD